MQLIWLYSFLLFLALVMGGCQGASESDLVKGKKERGPTSYRLRIPNRQQDLQQLIRLYAPADTFPQFVSTKIGEWEGPDSEKFLWRGRVIPESVHYLFNSIPGFEKETRGAYYATTRINLGRRTVALLTRTPGAYWSSRIYLFILDIKTRQFTCAYQLAESWGDAGDSYYLETHIRKSPPNRVQLDSRQTQCYPLDDDYKLFECTDSLQKAAWTGNKLLIQPKKQVHRRQYKEHG